MSPIKSAAARPSAAQALRPSMAVALRVALALVIVVAGLPASLLAKPASGSKPRVTLDEFFNAVDFSKVALSPDGHMVAIATQRADWDAERFREDLWLWRDSDGTLIPLTQSGHDSDPQWSPDGKWIAFLSDRDGESDKSDKEDDDKKGVTHLYVIPVGGGEAFPVTRGAEDVHSFAWSPDSKMLYFATRTPWTTKQKLPRAGARRPDFAHHCCGRPGATDRGGHTGIEEEQERQEEGERRGDRRDSRRAGGGDVSLSREEHGGFAGRQPRGIHHRQCFAALRGTERD